MGEWLIGVYLIPESGIGDSGDDVADGFEYFSECRILKYVPEEQSIEDVHVRQFVGCQQAGVMLQTPGLFTAVDVDGYLVVRTGEKLNSGQDAEVIFWF